MPFCATNFNCLPDLNVQQSYVGHILAVFSTQRILSFSALLLWLLQTQCGVVFVVITPRVKNQHLCARRRLNHTSTGSLLTVLARIPQDGVPPTSLPHAKAMEWNELLVEQTLSSKRHFHPLFLFVSLPLYCCLPTKCDYCMKRILQV